MRRTAVDEIESTDRDQVVLDQVQTETDVSSIPVAPVEQIAPSAPPTRPTELFWIGPMTPDNRPAEFFGGGPGVEPIPPRNLSAEDVAALTDAQWALIESPTGQRLYSPTNPEPAEPAS